MDENAKKAQEIQTEILRLRNQLSADTSDVGDYRIMKIYEARINAEPDPYSADTLIAQRQAARDRINTLKKEIRELRGETEEKLTEEEQKAQELNELDTGYERAKNQILMAYVAAVMAEDLDTQASLKAQLKELDAEYDAQRRG